MKNTKEFSQLTFLEERNFKIKDDIFKVKITTSGSYVFSNINERGRFFIAQIKSQSSLEAFCFVGNIRLSTIIKIKDIIAL